MIPRARNQGDTGSASGTPWIVVLPLFCRHPFLGPEQGRLDRHLERATGVCAVIVGVRVSPPGKPTPTIVVRENHGVARFLTIATPQGVDDLTVCQGDHRQVFPGGGGKPLLVKDVHDAEEDVGECEGDLVPLDSDQAPVKLPIRFGERLAAGGSPRHVLDELVECGQVRWADPVRNGDNELGLDRAPHRHEVEQHVGMKRKAVSEGTCHHLRTEVTHVPASTYPRFNDAECLQSAQRLAHDNPTATQPGGKLRLARESIPRLKTVLHDIASQTPVRGLWRLLPG